MPVARKAYFVLAALLLGTVIGLLIMAIRYNAVFTATTEWVDHTIVVLGVHQQALTGLYDYERGAIARSDLQSRFRRLHELTTDNPSQQIKADRSLRLLAALPGNLNSGELVRHPIADSIRAVLLDFQMEEIRLLNRREADSSQSRSSLKTAIITLMGAIFALLFAGAYVTNYNFNRRLKAEEGRRDENDRALAREKDLNAMKSRFVSLASHEFKTPLTVVLSSSHLAERYDGPETAEKRLTHLRRIRSNAGNLRRLLDDFLSVEKLETGLVRNEPVATDLVKLVEEAVQDMAETCKELQRMEISVEGKARPVAVDRHMLRNILNNLLSNAIKYSPERTAIRLGLVFLHDAVLLSVADNGIGIPADEQERLFERFFRASNTSGISGTGLGLSIVKKYVDLMGGEIRLESRQGLGSTFFIQLPMTIMEPADGRH